MQDVESFFLFPCETYYISVKVINKRIKSKNTL